MALLLVLLVLAWLGSQWAAAGQKRAFGTPSGIEFVVLGLLIGPEALGLLGHEAMRALEPVAIVALGWIGLGFGLECGVVDARRAPVGRLALGLSFTVLTALITALLARVAIDYFRLGEPAERTAIAGAVGLVSAETTRHAVRWIGADKPAARPLSSLLRDMAAADDAPVLVGLAVLFACEAPPRVVSGVTLGPLALTALTLGTGALLGLLATFLLRISGSTVERWTILLGVTWLATGVARSLGLAALTATFALGLILSAASRHAARVRARVAQNEGAVLLPALLLVGAHLEPPESDAEIALVGAALLARVALSFVLGALLALARPDARGLGRWLGAGMLASGTLTMLVAFGLTLRGPPALARPALLVAFLGTLLGEVLGPPALRRAFGELEDDPTPVPAEVPR